MSGAAVTTGSMKGLSFPLATDAAVLSVSSRNKYLSSSVWNDECVIMSTIVLLYMWSRQLHGCKTYCNCSMCQYCIYLTG